jgi:hypothetical protein
VKGDNVSDQLACSGEDLAEGLRRSAVKMRRLIPHLSIICRVRGHRVAGGLVGNPFRMTTRTACVAGRPDTSTSAPGTSIRCRYVDRDARADLGCDGFHTASRVSGTATFAGAS